MSDEDKQYELRRLIKEVASEMYKRKTAKDKAVRMMSKMISQPKFQEKLALLYPGMNKEEATQEFKGQVQVASEPHKNKVRSVNKQGKRYITDWDDVKIDIDNMANDKIMITDEYNEINGEYTRLVRASRRATYPYYMASPKGQGKTTMIKKAAKEEGWAYKSVQGSPFLKERHLIGAPQIDNEASYFKPGLLSIAMKALEVYDKVWIAVDDFTVQSHEAQIEYLPLCDGRKALQVNGEWMYVPKGKRLFLTATGNPASYGGVNSMPEQLLSRFRGEELRPPTAEQIKSIIDWDKIDEETVQQPLVQIMKDTYSLKVKNDVDYVISIRDIKMFVDNYRDNLNDSLLPVDNLTDCIESVILIKYTDMQEKELMRVHCQETFGVDIDEFI